MNFELRDYQREAAIGVLGRLGQARSAWQGERWRATWRDASGKRRTVTGHPDRGAVWILWTDGTRRGVPTAEHLPEIERLYGPPAQYENARAWDLVLSMYNPK